MTQASYKITNKMFEIFDHLHAHPEIGWKEEKTTAYIKSLVSPYDVDVKTFDDCTGVVVDIGKGKPVVALRGDMDALWQEVDRTFQANHSCGHDAHMTIALGVFLTLANGSLPDSGTFRFIFQPAEEKGTGALKMVEHGVVDDVDVLYGMHLRPKEELADGRFAPFIQHGAAQFMAGRMEGEDAHGARPHLNANAIQVGSEFFQHVNGIQADPKVPHSAKMTAFQADGGSPNIIPGNASFSLDVRAQTNEVMQQLTEKIERIASMLEHYHDVDITLETGANVAAAVPDDEAVRILEDAITSQMGETNLAPGVTTTGGDDFHFYTLNRPSLQATMLAIGCDLGPGLHHPQMTFNQNVIPEATKILTEALVQTAMSYDRGSGQEVPSSKEDET